jgi:hypothetical protein
MTSGNILRTGASRNAEKFLANNSSNEINLNPRAPEPDWELLDGFLELFYPNPDEPIHFRKFPPKSTELNERGSAKTLPDELKNHPQFWPAKYEFSRREILTSEYAQKTLIDANTYSGLYFVVNAGGIKNEDITRINSFFSESDSLSIEEQHTLLDAFVLDPSIRIETGKSVHAYWLTPVENDYTPEDFRSIQKRLIQHFNSDRSLHNPNRLMRVPSFNHVSWNHESGELRYKPVQLVELEPERRYTLEQMVAELTSPTVLEQRHPKEKEPKHKTPGTTRKTVEFEMPVFETGGSYEKFEELLNEARKRLMLLPGASLNNGYVHTKGVCHNGSGNTAIHINVETGQFACAAGCPTSAILRAVGLPQRPNTETKVKATSAWNLGEFLAHEFPPVDEAMKYIERGTLSQLVAATNVGKTTLLLNASVALAAGEEFWPLVSGAVKTRKVMYVDFETNRPKMHQVLTKILSVEPYTSPDVRALVEQNILLLVDTEVDDVPLTLSNPEHLSYVEQQAREFGADLVVIDNSSSAFILRNENDNSEVAREVMLPLKNFARRTNAATVLVHHTGKPGENSKQTVDAFLGRGASNYGSLSRTIYGLVRAENLGPGYVVLHNTKNKSGPLLDPVTMRLDFNTLWFSPIGQQQSLEVTARAVHEFVCKQGTAGVSEITEHFMQSGVSARTVSRRVEDAVKMGFMKRKNKRAKYEPDNCDNLVVEEGLIS